MLLKVNFSPSINSALVKSTLARCPLPYYLLQLMALDTTIYRTGAISRRNILTMKTKINTATSVRTGIKNTVRSTIVSRVPAY